MPVGRAAEPHRLFEHGVEYGSEVAGRAVDNLQHLGGRGLLFERFAQGALALLALGDVADRADQPLRPALVVADRNRAVLDPAVFAAAQPDAVFAMESGGAALQRIP